MNIIYVVYVVNDSCTTYGLVDMRASYSFLQRDLQQRNKMKSQRANMVYGIKAPTGKK